jgi:5'(3')-deoxyribonucleotidase
MSQQSTSSETKKPRLCVDIDNVLAQTDLVMRRVISEYTEGRVNYEYNHIIEFDYHRCVDGAGNSSTREEWKGIHSRFAESHNILAIEPMPHAVEQLKRLSERFDIHIATTRPPQARKPTIEWLERHGFPPFDLHFLKHREKHAWFTPFFAAVEDDYSQAVAFLESGSPAFLLEHPWNRTKPKRDKLEWIADWFALADRLESLLGTA